MGFGFGIFFGFLLCLFIAAIMAGSTSEANKEEHKHTFGFWQTSKNGECQCRKCTTCGWIEVAEFGWKSNKPSKKKK